jgi:hypothetical protein
MTPTHDIIRAAGDAAFKIASAGRDAQRCIDNAAVAWELDAPAWTIRSLQDARDYLVRLRRSQTAAIDNIDAAIASAQTNQGLK